MVRKLRRVVASTGFVQICRERSSSKISFERCVLCASRRRSQWCKRRRVLLAKEVACTV
ncbi:hypothetical protein RHGRI_000185 [Rhododendron griersonianum]|uniref:Uncharacterized protein n=1 Tax=Rhododendron griersonianum TaxID=479676 RepID=A0AAV6LG03_9ERIC|nr:hypothetical protein RHGRI_000185 [Rhododendron griersonianum]